MQCNIPDKWEAFINARLQTGLYGSVGDVLEEALELLRQDTEESEEERAEIEELLLEGMRSGPSLPMTAEDWDYIEREGKRLIEERKSRHLSQ